MKLIRALAKTSGKWSDVGVFSSCVQIVLQDLKKHDFLLLHNCCRSKLNI